MKWTDADNARRYALIERKVDGVLTADERWELAALQRRAIAHQNKVAPLPIAGAKALLQQLRQLQVRLTK